VQIVDSHCHVSPIWYEPVETLLAQMDRNGVAQAVLIQLLGQFHNDYQQACLLRYPGRFASVVAIDVGRPDAVETLARLAADGASGVRLRPAARSAGPDPLAIWRAAESAGLAVSCVGNSETFASSDFYEIASRFTDLPIVLEHLGGTSQADASEKAIAERRRVFELAALPNVYLKLPGLGELAPRAAQLPASARPLADASNLIDAALDLFGPDRIMWGSDFPPVAAREGYANALGWVREELTGLPVAARADIFGNTARRVFKLTAS